LTNLVKAAYLGRMKQVSLYEAKTHLSKLVDEASAGEEIVIAKNGKPLARLLPLSTPAQVEPRRLGLYNEANKHIDWDKWDRAFDAADKEVERLFNEGDGPSALDEMAPKPKRSKVKGLAEKGKAYRPSRKGRTRT
jgi:prevent-host-death family protein